MIAARLLVQKGARYLVLVSRHGAATPELQADVQWLEQHGVKVSLPQVDCAEAGELAQLFQTIQRTLPPVRGILHAAMVLDDAPLAQMSRERFDVVWRPKAQAAWNLHQCSLDLDLDFFAMFSSISALIGNVGQGNYVAANSFLDALAWYRRSRGLPAVSLAWGAIAAGVVARQPALLNHFQALGIRAFTPEECSGLLERVLKQRPVYAAIMDIDWTRWRAAQPSVASRPRFSRFVSSSAQAVADPRLAVLLESALEDRQKLVEEFLCEDLSSVIHLPASKIDVQLTFENMGFDSLMIVELTTALNMRWGISLSSIENIYGQTISSVASQLLLNILKQHRPHELAACNQDVVDRLSEEEIDALLSEMSQPPLRTGELSLRTSNA
jgi:acyl carrier protein